VGREQRRAVGLRVHEDVAGAEPAAAPTRRWDVPSAIDETSPYRQLVVAYGSNFGTSKGLAERFAERSEVYGYACDLVTLNELVERPPPTEPWLLVVMTPTYTGNPPSNAAAFKAWLDRAEPGSATWCSCRYVVWGLGNSQWNAFLAFPRHVHERLSQLGATPAGEFGYADVGSPLWEERHAEWTDRVWPALLELSGAKPSEAAAARIAAEQEATGELTRGDSRASMTRSLVIQRASLVPLVLTNSVGIETVEAHVVACRELQPDGSPQRTRHLELTLPPGVSYTAGDHLGICPKNDDERVERLARRLGADLDGVFTVPRSMDVHAVPKGVVLQARNVLTNLVDITGRPTVRLLDLLLAKVGDPIEQSRLEAVRDALRPREGRQSPFRAAMRAAVGAGGYDVVQLLEESPSCSVNIFELLQVAEPLRPRYYSPSSSPKIHGDRVAHLAVGLEEAPVPGMSPRRFRGMCASYVHSLREGDSVNVFLESADGFHLQEDVATPMIFVSMGTGFAPMRAFLWERLAMRQAGVRLAEAALFNGVRASDDYAYRDEIERFAAEGVLDHLHVAASRERPPRREYVQDRIREHGALVWRLLDAGGYVYVCGSQPMRDAVRDAFVDVVVEHGALPREHAEAYVDELEAASQRYRPDLWG
jgi:cytochrome P450/NADPH-cytochrome P450 reductase